MADMIKPDIEEFGTKRSSIEHIVPRGLNYTTNLDNLLQCLTEERNSLLAGIHRAKEVERAFGQVTRLLDLLLAPESSESAKGDLAEGLENRLSDPRHARRWLWSQAIWIVLYRGIDLLGRVRRAWAGK